VEGLKTVRVIVLDDDEGEAIELMRALWARRIPALYLSGEENFEEAERLRGVRLAFLDMDLTPGSLETKTKIAALINALKRIISDKNGPFLAIAWTKHIDLIPEFEQLSVQYALRPLPIGVVGIAKDECKDTTGYNLDTIKSSLSTKLSEFSPLLFLQVWEQSCLDAATMVTDELSNLAGTTGTSLEEIRTKWRLELLKIINSMAAAAVGRSQLKDGNSAFGAFCSALYPLHADRLENRKSDLYALVKKEAKEILSKEAKQESDPSANARINEMLHLSYDGINQFSAGNLYLIDGGSPLLGLFENLNTFISTYVHGSPTGADWKPNFESLKTRSRLVLVEVSPVCDHAQGKVNVSRLVAGLLIPRDEIEKNFEATPKTKSSEQQVMWEARMIAVVRAVVRWWHSVKGEAVIEAKPLASRFVKRADFLWEVGPFSLNLPGADSPNDYYLVANSRFVFSLPPKQIKTEKAFCRLRSQVFSSLQFWLANQVGRPGMLLIE
jgi:hypothetical protein